jgi:type II secretory pathway pseudopilin PulG
VLLYTAQEGCRSTATIKPGQDRQIYYPAEQDMGPKSYCRENVQPGKFASTCPEGMRLKNRLTGRTVIGPMRTGALPGFSMRPHQKEQGVALVELVIVVAIALIIAAMAVPTFLSTRRNYRVTGDARDIASEILLAKMRAASDFTQARARFNTAANNGYAANTFQLEIWDKTNSVWAVDAPSGTLSLSQGITFGYGTQSNPPPTTQATIGQAPGCTPGSGTNPGGGTAIANTACVVFNSRSMPIDTTGAPTSNDAIYLTDGSGVYATTISATGLPQAWRIDVGDTNAAHWAKR